MLNVLDSLDLYLLITYNSSVLQCSTCTAVHLINVTPFVLSYYKFGNPAHASHPFSTCMICVNVTKMGMEKMHLSLRSL